MTQKSETAAPSAPKTKKSKSVKQVRNNGAAESRQRAIQILPTERVNIDKQLGILRGYAIASGPGGKSVGNETVGAIVKMAPSTVSMCNPFFSDVGFIRRENGTGYQPAPEVLSFNRAFEWNPETSAHKLSPLLERTWFAEVLLPRASFSSISEDDAITALAEEAHADPRYRPQLNVLLDFLEVTGLIGRENGMIQTRKPSATRDVPAQPTEAAPSELQEARPAGQSARLATSFSKEKEGLVAFNVSVRVDMSEFKGWSADRITSFFSGIAQVLAAKGDIEGEAGVASEA